MVFKKKKFFTFQDTIFKLQNYWSKNGCIILQPYDIEVGAGTFHLKLLVLNHGKRHMYNLRVDLQMVDMVKIQTDFSIIINFKQSLNRLQII